MGLVIAHTICSAMVNIVMFVFGAAELIGTYNDEDIYLFDSSHSDGAEHKYKYSGHRNNATGLTASNIRLSDLMSHCRREPQ